MQARRVEASVEVAGCCADEEVKVEPAVAVGHIEYEKAVVAVAVNTEHNHILVVVIEVVVEVGDVFEAA